MFGIFACGSNRNVVRPDSLKVGRLAISSNGGATLFWAVWLVTPVAAMFPELKEMMKAQLN
jgi:hypothetical protein